MKNLEKNNQRSYDVIIVLGAAVWRGGRPSPALQRRVSHAASLMRKDKAGYLLLTGGFGKYPPTEARVMKDLAVNQGVPPDKIVLEEKGVNTFKSVVYCVQIMAGRNWTKAIIVSDPYHLYRCLFLFRRMGVKAIGSGAPGGRQANPLWKWVYYYVRESIAFIWYLVRILILK
ncbi:YdcF family protein [Thermodesulfobacteriota bacterium]